MIRRATALAAMVFAVGLATGLATTAEAAGPSYDCGLPDLNQTELTICFNPDLARFDVELSNAYKTYLSTHGEGENAALRAGQKVWLKERNACGSDVACIRKAYDERLTLISGASEGTLASAPPASPPGFPKQAFSWGGVVRNGPGTGYGRAGSLPEGTVITLVAPTGQMMNGYEWFYIRTAGGMTGYQWGGIICGNGAEVSGAFQSCTPASFR